MLHKEASRGFYNRIKTYKNSGSKIFHSIRIRSFFSKLLLSYSIVIIICVCSMGILSYNLLSSSIIHQSIKSNDILLNQFKNTVDNLILKNMNDFSLKILQDINANPEIYYFFTSSMENNMYGMISIQEYCDRLKTLNPMLYFVGIYFNKNQLLISNEGVRSTFYDKMSNQKDLTYYYNLIQSSTSNPSWHVNNNFRLAYENYIRISPSNIIHMVRKIPVISQTSNPGGGIIISIDENVFYELVKETAAHNLDKVIICDAKGAIVSHTDKELLGMNISDFVYGDKIAHASEPSGNFLVNINNIPSVVSFCTSGYNSWKYITVTAMEKYNSVTGFLLRIIIFISAATLVASFIISVIPAFRLSNPIWRLVGFCIGVNKNPGLKLLNEYKIIHSTIEDLSFTKKEQEQKFIDALPVLKDNFFQCLISGQQFDQSELEMRMRMLDLSFPYKYFSTLTFSNTAEDILLSEYAKIGIVSSLEKIFESDHSKSYHCVISGNTAVIINFSMEEEKIHELLYSFEISMNNNLIKGLFFSMGTTVENLTQLSGSYTLADAGLKYRYIYPDKKLILPREILSHEANHVMPDKNMLSSFIASLRKQDRIKAVNDLNHIIATFRTETLSIATIKETLAACVAAVDEAAATYGIPIHDIYSDDGNIKNQFKKIDNLFGFQEWVTEMITYMFDGMSSRQYEINREMIQKAVDLIKKDIRNPNLSLSTVAGALYISQSHLSRIFKSETGLTFIEYVINLKLDYCKDLLINTTMKIDEIASVMGYSTSHYFINRFKTKFGCTPKNYRRKHSSTNLFD